MQTKDVTRNQKSTQWPGSACGEPSWPTSNADPAGTLFPVIVKQNKQLMAQYWVCVRPGWGWGPRVKEGLGSTWAHESVSVNDAHEDGRFAGRWNTPQGCCCLWTLNLSMLRTVLGASTVSNVLTIIFISTLKNSVYYVQVSVFKIKITEPKS